MRLLVSIYFLWSSGCRDTHDIPMYMRVAVRRPKWEGNSIEILLLLAFWKCHCRIRAAGTNADLEIRLLKWPVAQKRTKFQNRIPFILPDDHPRGGISSLDLLLPVFLRPLRHLWFSPLFLTTSIPLGWSFLLRTYIYTLLFPVFVHQRKRIATGRAHCCVPPNLYLLFRCPRHLSTRISGRVVPRRIISSAFFTCLSPSLMVSMLYGFRSMIFFLSTKQSSNEPFCPFLYPLSLLYYFLLICILFLCKFYSSLFSRL